MLNQEIALLKGKMKVIELELINKPMTQEDRLQKVIALDKLNDAINLLESIY